MHDVEQKLWVLGGVGSVHAHQDAVPLAVHADGMRFTINLVTPDNGEKFIIELENSMLTNLEGFLAEDADLTLTINRSDLELTMMGAKELSAQIADGTANIEGDATVLD